MNTGKKLGLILVSHGSPSAPWNATMERVTKSVKAALKARAPAVFSDIELANLEFVKPDIAEACEQMEARGCTRIVAHPLFISVSSHSERDIPNALNIRYHDHSDPEIRRYIGKVPITYTCPMDHGPVLPEVVASCAKEISVDPTKEAALILSHGGGCEHFWEHMHRRVAKQVTAVTGIQNVSWIPVQTGRSPQSQDKFVAKAQSLIGTSAEKVLVLSCFGGLSGSQFLERIDQGLAKRQQASLSALFSDRLVGCSGWIEKGPVIEEIANVVLRAAAAAEGLPVQPEPHSKDSYPPYNPPFGK